jgi:hypothetical protein
MKNIRAIQAFIWLIYTMIIVIITLVIKSEVDTNVDLLGIVFIAGIIALVPSYLSFKINSKHLKATI